jgi:hypothetical protein
MIISNFATFRLSVVNMPPVSSLVGFNNFLIIILDNNEIRKYRQFQKKLLGTLSYFRERIVKNYKKIINKMTVL